MMSATGAAHGAAWMADAWYRRAWFTAPSAVFLSCVCLLFGALDRPDTPPTPPGWVHPIDRRAESNALATLRDRAKTDAEALTMLRQRADRGSALAQFYMATLFDPLLQRDKASAERTSEAIQWYRKAADQRNPQAEANLGNLLARDFDGHPADFAEAYKWLEQASLSLPMAQRELGQLYRFGRGVPIDSAKGMDLIRTASDHGDAGAEMIIAEALERGTDGMTQDHQQAVLLLQKAAMQNNIAAQRELAIHLQKGDGVAVDASKARYWFSRAASAGDAYSKTQLAETPALPASTPTSPPISKVTPFSFAPIKR